jgi:predicted GIY-YIG superfamily endonuclease
MYLVYIIICDNLSYVGMTNNFLNRWLQHNGIISGGAKYTKKKCNWYPICIIDGFKNKSEAMQCEWKIKSRKSKISRKFKYATGRIQYLNLLLKNEKWTSKSPKIKDQNLTVYIDNDYENLIDSVITQELYWKWDI